MNLDQPDSFAERAGSLMIAARGFRPFRRLRPITNIAHSSNGEFLGFIQFRQALPDRRWIVRSIGVADGVYESDRIVEELLEYSFRRAGTRGVKRLFTRVACDSDLGVSSRRTGFEPYTSESLYMLHGKPRAVSLSKRVREQDSTDTWAVHQLYHASAPRHVQFAEAWTSHRWDSANSKRHGQTWRSFVLEDGYQILAHARVLCGNRTAVVEVMFSTEAIQTVPEFCHDVLGRLANESGINRVYVVARAHQVELVTCLEDMGLEQISRQDVMVRYTAAKISAKVIESPFPVTQDVLDRAPNRVPTYLNRPLREKSIP